MGFRAAPKMLLVDDDVERTSGNVLVAPLDDEDVVSALAGTVDDRVLSVSLVTYDDLLARDSRSHHADQQHAVTYAKHIAEYKDLLSINQSINRRLLA